MLEVGQKAPAFCLPNQDGVEICSRDLKGKWIVLYFYPKDNTPGCTTQACDFTQDEAKFEDLDAVILGVSADGMKKHQNFIAKYDLTITLLSDESTDMMQEYGVWQLKKNYGKEYMGIVRTTYIINPQGEISAAWDKVRVRQKKKKDGQEYEIVHVQEVQESLVKLQR